MRNYNILLLAPYAYPNVGPESIVANKLLETLLNRNFKIEVISWESANSIYEPGPRRQWARVLEHIIPLKTVRLIDSLSALQRIFNIVALDHVLAGIEWSAKALRLVVKKTQIAGPCVIVTRCKPFWAHFVPLLLGRRARPWIATWNDPPFKRFMPPPYRSNRAKTGYFQALYLRLVGRKADWHIFPSSQLRDHFVPYLGQDILEKSSVIPHVALDRYLAEGDGVPLAFRICHAGSLDDFRDPGTLIEGLRLFERDFPGAKVEISFLGSTGRFTQTLSDRFSVGEKTHPYEETLKALRRHAVLLVIEAPCPVGIFLPSKFVDYVQAGRPILALSPAKGALHDILVRHGGGIAADVTSPESISHAIKTMYKSWQRGLLQKEFGSDRLRVFFGEKRIAGHYQKVFEKLCPSAGRRRET